MKVKVLIRFRDRYDRSVVHSVGDVIDIAGDARVMELEERGIVEIVEKAAPSEDAQSPAVEEPAAEPAQAEEAKAETQRRKPSKKKGGK